MWQEVEQEMITLPDTLKGWTRMQVSQGGWKLWKHVRNFFSEHGYDLYVQEPTRPYSTFLVPRDSVGLVPDSFGLYGTRILAPGFRVMTSVVWAARDKQKRDVIIKVVGRGDEGANEIDNLRFLSSEPLKSDPDNGTVPVLEFLQYDVWTFAVLPRWGDSTRPEMRDVKDALELCLQVTDTVAFFHRNLMAHLDIAHENIMINFLGIEQTHEDARYHPFRELFPVRYAFIDFGTSCRFSPDSEPASRVSELYYGRPHKAPELYAQKPYNPFAADVYQAATMFYQWFHSLVPLVPGFLPILQDMTKAEPSSRIAMQEAQRRLHQARDELQPQQLQKFMNFDFEWNKIVPQETDCVPNSQADTAH